MPDSNTINFNLVLARADRQNWTTLMNDNLKTIDALIATYVSVANLQGLWANATEYDIGDNVVDGTTGVVYTCQVDHTSASAPTTFLEDRTAHSTYWTTFSVAARNRGAWATATAYALNDFVLAEGTKYAMAISAHTSGASFATDLAAGKWTVLVDLSAAGSLVLPTLSGAVDANKIVMTDSGGNSYVINTAATLASLLNAAGLATLANPAFTGDPTAPTRSAEDNDTSIATTQYADRAVRNIVIRRQLFAASGTYTPNAKLIYADIECWGSGGGGGGCAGGSGGFGSAAGGGGAGSYSRTLASAATIGASQTVTVDAAGTAGSAGNNNGGAGGDVSVGSLCIGKGGSGGTGAAAGATGAGGAGGVAGTGDITTVGQYGATGLALSAAVNSPYGGFGGSTSIGAGGRMQVGSATGQAGAKGGGGAGGSSSDGSPAQAGGAGGTGYVIITEYCYG